MEFFRSETADETYEALVLMNVMICEILWLPPGFVIFFQIEDLLGFLLQDTSITGRAGCLHFGARVLVPPGAAARGAVQSVRSSAGAGATSGVFSPFGFSKCKSWKICFHILLTMQIHWPTHTQASCSRLFQNGSADMLAPASCRRGCSFVARCIVGCHLRDRRD